MKNKDGSAVYAIDIDGDGEIDIIATTKDGDAIVWNENNKY